ncbi:MAG: TraU family protein [Cellvibrionaceae bacterium]|nr:TraU family protein [Cellvibrionaceae bacterium]
MLKKYSLALLCFVSLQAMADEPGCINANIISGKLLTKFCWDCLLPIHVSGVTIKQGGYVPSDAVDNPLCICYDDLGVPEPGFTNSMWMPARLVELQRVPGCSSVFNGMRFPFDRLKMGSISRGNKTSRELTYLHYHYYAFPVLTILSLMSNRGCIGDGWQDLDLMYMSEVDPTWNNSILAFFTHPEAAAVANPIAVAACAADATAAAVQKPLNNLFWCAGSWGMVYPTAGYTYGEDETVRKSSLLKIKAQAALHRRGLAHKTSGRAAMCKSQVDSTMDKDMYAYTLIHPLPETEKKHVLGEPTLTWGAGRTIPAVGEDLVYVIWRWSDCCSRY